MQDTIHGDMAIPKDAIVLSPYNLKLIEHLSVARGMLYMAGIGAMAGLLTYGAMKQFQSKPLITSTAKGIELRLDYTLSSPKQSGRRIYKTNPNTPYRK